MNEIYEAAVKYAKRGWSVFPVRKNKTPYTPNGFHNATTDLNVITRWWQEYPDANVGIATGSMSHGLTVIDIDIDDSKGIHGDESFQDWCDEEGVFIDSLTAVTGRGGKHLYFTSTYPYGNKTGCLPGVDIRGEGGYVIAPPSIHENGNPYYFDGDEDEEEIVCAQEDSDVEYFFNEMCKSPMGNKEPLKVPNKVNEGGRNDMIFKMASSMQARGDDDDVILATCQGYNEKNCHPPLPDDELLFIVRNVLNRYEKGAPKKEAEEPHEEKETPKLTKANDIKNKEMRDLKVYVGKDCEVPFLVEGTCILSAKAKIGKSWFCNNLCKTITEGKPFLGYEVNRCHAIYFDLETVEQLQKKRLQKMSEGDYDDGFYMISEAPLINGGFEEMMDSFMEEDPQIGVIIVDVFQKIRKPKKANESDYDATYREIGVLNKIAKKYHISIILVCHDRKTVEDADPFSNILGSTALQGATDQMIVMYKDKFDDEFTHIAVKGRTIDGLIKMDAQIVDGMWIKSERTAFDIYQQEKLKEEYLKSEFRPLIVGLMSEQSSWEGRCNEFIRDCKDAGILDRKADPSLKQLGLFFTKFITMASKLDHIKMGSIKNGTGGKTYTLTVETVDTVDGWVKTVDGVPFENG